jgi:ArsR family transcriptional regulator
MKPVRVLSIDEGALGPIVEHLGTLADPIRCRMLLLLERHELTVSELCSVLQLPQSTVSRHLKTLADAAWVGSRRDGTSRYYAMAAAEQDANARRLWPLVREQAASTAAAVHDERRLQGVLARRRSRSAAFFSSAAGQWDHLRAELFGETFHLHALIGLLDPTLVAGDLGCGTGQVSALLAACVAHVVAVDSSPDMLREARRRLRDHRNVDVLLGGLEALPLVDDRLDVAVLALVLHHAPDPGRVLAECARVVKPGGRALVIDMLPHDRAEYQQQMGHVWLGFSESQIGRMLVAAGFTAVRARPLPIDPDAKGPALFTAVGTKR